jgi:phosphate transport system protein
VRNLEPEGQRVGLLFALVTEALAQSTSALLSGDVEIGRAVVNGDPVIDNLTVEIESSVWRRLKWEPPEWEDLRRAVGVLQILPELERSADLAAHIAQRALTGIGSEMTPVSRGIVQRMSEVALDLWNRAAQAFAEASVASVDASVGDSVDDSVVDCVDFEETDEEIDVLHERLTNEVATGVMPPAVAAQVTLLSRFYERLGDHAVNVAHRLDGLPK